ncbi:hypothetical protein NDU88_001988 [Pleurodeles waltl]|uniref:Uncharacterized protein n=1 Tax=Pleurodeles waltl TaxID=8319 RepID=A0AAV7VDH5_PLEWA|nr:hypothetical protein NDU88_001988 [Pleurodeles waltl]
MIAVMAGAPAKPGHRHECDRVQGRASLRCWPRCALPHSRAPQLSRGAGMNAGECKGGARAGRFRPEHHQRKPRVSSGRWEM